MLRSPPCVTVLALCLVPFAAGVVSKSRVGLTSNKYSGLVIAVNPSIPENQSLVDSIKKAWTEASPVLFAATRNRAYFGDITILLPKTWKSFSHLQTSTGETYDKSDVLIADPNPSQGDNPYTVQYGECGTPGSYIHLTPNYLLLDDVSDNFGSRGKVIVHEWAHYRWGVFDETSSTDPFYDDPSGNTLYDVAEDDTLLSYTQCGKYFKMCCLDGNPAHQSCEPDPRQKQEESLSHCTRDNTGYYSTSCICYPQAPFGDYNSSIMSYQNFDNIYTFCEDTNNLKLKHNIYAPNDQNRLCDMKSTWHVISNSDDFNGANNPISKTSGFEPSFTLKIAQDSQRFVLVIDTSGSMSDLGTSGMTRLEQAVTAASYFISYSAPDGSYVGIVEFDSSAATLVELTKLDRIATRESLKSHLKSLVANGGTGIGNGIRKGIEVLESKSNPAGGGYLLVMTDGEENVSPYVSEVTPEVLSKKVIVQTLLVYTSANQPLIDLSIDSGGDWFFAGDDDLLALIDAYNQMGEVEDGNPNEKTFEVLSETVKLDNGDHKTSVNIDFTIGNKTVFTYTWSYGNSTPHVSIEPPSKSCIFSNHPENKCGGNISEDTTFKTLTFTIAGRAEVGMWTSTVGLPSSAAQTIVIVVTSMPADLDTPPIMVESSLESRDGIPIVYAQVTQGFSPVLGANVTATLSKNGKPNGDSVQLYDAGADPDTRRNDGVYSRYLTGLTGDRYSVKIKVESAFGEYNGSMVNSPHSRATYNPGYVTENGTIVSNPNGATFLPKNSTFGVTAEQLGNFSRQASAGAFEYLPPTTPGGTAVDTLPPSKVIDLTASQNDFNNFTKGIALSFSAPGDDYDSGNANRYEIRYTTGSIEDLIKDFTSNQVVDQSSVLEGNILAPQVAGTTERIVVETPPAVIGAFSSISIGFALRAIDDANNLAKVSNVATLRFYISPPAFAAAATTVGPTSIATEQTSIEDTTLQGLTTIYAEATTEARTTTLEAATTEHVTPTVPTPTSPTTIYQSAAAATTTQKVTTKPTSGITTVKKPSGTTSLALLTSTAFATSNKVTSSQSPASAGRSTSTVGNSTTGATTAENPSNAPAYSSSSDTASAQAVEQSTQPIDDNKNTTKASTALALTSAATTEKGCKDCSPEEEKDLTWVYITVPVVVVLAGGGIGLVWWLHHTQRLSIFGSSGTVAPSELLEDVENGEGESSRHASQSAWED